MMKYVIRVDDGCDNVKFEFDNGSSAIAFAQVALEHLSKKERTYHDGGVTISMIEIKPVEKPDDDNENDNEEEDEEDE